MSDDETRGPAPSAADGPLSRDFERRTFSDRERAVIRPLAEAVFYDESDRDLSDRFDWLVPEVDRLVSATSWRVRLAYRITLSLLSIAPFLVSLRFCRLSTRPVTERAALLARLDHHPIGVLRLLLVPWKTALAFVYYEHPAALAETGYDDTCATGAPRRPGILGVVPLAEVTSRRSHAHGGPT